MLATSIISPAGVLALAPNVEVFKTNIRSRRHAQAVVALLEAHFAGLRITLDLDDCDRILRIQGSAWSGPLPVSAIRRLVATLGFQIEVLAD